MNDIWQEHKKFIVAVSAGMLVFLVGETIIGSSYTSKVTASKRALQSRERSLRSLMPSNRDLREMRDTRDELDGRWSAARDRLAFVPDPKYLLSDDEPRPDDVYFNVVNQVKQEVGDAAERRNIRIPDNFGLPATTPRTREEVKRYLRALDVVQRVVRLAIEAQVDEITDIDIPKTGRSSSRARRRQAAEDFLERQEIRFTLEGSADSLARLVMLLQRPETFLVLGSGSRITGPEPESPGPCEAVLTIAALDIDSFGAEE
ncbi:MAG: Amuc_1100 family pilus-like protein [Planctomycetota bacterium]